jgi:ketosteroid isomerase-like protein
MAEVDDFLTEVLPGYLAAEKALHNGDAEPRKAMWSHEEPLTVFGAAVTKQGWAEIEPMFDWLAAGFSGARQAEHDIVAAGASGDLAYIVAFEHTTASVHGAPAEPYTLRVTTVFRRERGVWKVVHRHGDGLSDPGAQAMVERHRARDE